MFMNFWKKLPYWLKGGIISGGVTFIFIVLFYSCTILDTKQGSFLCLPFMVLSPIFPFAILFDKINSISQYQLPFVFVPVASTVFWFFVGSLIGSLVGYIKSKKKSL